MQINKYGKMIVNIIAVACITMGAIALCAFMYFSVAGNREFMHSEYFPLLLSAYMFTTIPVFINGLLGNGLRVWNKV